jgi:hypothetical protein
MFLNKLLNYGISIVLLSFSDSVLAQSPVIDWKGTTTVWETASNWSSGTVPGVNSAVRIGVVSFTNQPTLNSSPTVYSVTFGAAKATTLTVAKDKAMTIKNNLTVNSASTPTITGDNGQSAINIAPGGIINISGTGTLTLTPPLAFTLMSDASGSASIGQITSASITGPGANSIRVQRYLTGGVGYRGYRLLSSPVYVNTVAPNNVYSINYLQNDVYLTGAAGGGFDKTGNPTIYLYREDLSPSNTSFTNGNFSGVSNILPNSQSNYIYSVTGSIANTVGTYNLPVGNGFLFFFRGDRAAASLAVETTTTYVPVSATLSAVGKLNAGQITVHNWHTPASSNLGYTGTGTGANYAVRGFNLVGNPYASSIDWEQYNTSTKTSGIYASGIGTTIYELNPKNNNYATYQKGGASTNNGSNIIVSGEAFFVVATSSSAQLIFNEDAKSVAQNTGLNLLMSSPLNISSLTTPGINHHIRLQMAADSANTDDIYIGFDASASNKYVFNEDAPYKAGNGLVKLASVSNDNIRLAINKLPLPKAKQISIPLYLAANASGTYKLNISEITNLSQSYQVWLMDKFKNDSLDMRHNPTYAFNITTDTNSYGSNRFKLIIKQGTALAASLLSFTAAKMAGGAQLDWTIENESDYTGFIIERSTDNGATFTALGKFNSSKLGAYNFLDQNPANGANQYRLMITGDNEDIFYSNIVTLVYNASNTATKNIVIYPNPVKNTLQITITPTINSKPDTRITNSITSPSITMGSNLYRIEITNTMGFVVCKEINQQGLHIDVSALRSGIYILKVNNDIDNSIVGQTKFVKL